MGMNGWISLSRAMPQKQKPNPKRASSYPKQSTSPTPHEAVSMSPVTALLAGTAVPPAFSAAVAPPRHVRPSVGFSLPGGGIAALAVECSSRPQKKGTKHHMKTRPKKTARWDIKRGPTQYPPLPKLPPDWTLVASGATVDVEATQEEGPVLELASAAAPAAAD